MNYILEKLLQKSCLGLIGAGQNPLVGHFNVLTTNLINHLHLSGDEDARKKFITAITVLLEKKTTGAADLTVILPNFIKILLQLAVDNKIVDEKTAGKIGVHFSKFQIFFSIFCSFL